MQAGLSRDFKGLYYVITPFFYARLVGFKLVLFEGRIDGAVHPTKLIPLLVAIVDRIEQSQMKGFSAGPAE